jgi:hypothetical protein
MALDFKPVQSSNLESVAWADGALHVRFKGGSEYRYADVPEAVFYGLMAARSKGEFLNQYVKGQYPFTRVR